MWELADLLVDQDHPGDFNQSIMELGRCIFGPNLTPWLILIIRGTATIKSLVKLGR
jgi:hypothetical protein